MTIAESIKNYYEHEDFINNYAVYLFEDTHFVKDRIKEVCKSYEFNEYYGKNIDITEEQLEQVFEYIYDNSNEFQSTFSSYYVGCTCISSIAFGEQEEQLTGIYNHKTGKNYTLPYLKRCFNDACFYVSGELAYYDLSDTGVYLDLLAVPIPLLKELTK